MMNIVALRRHEDTRPCDTESPVSEPAEIGFHPPPRSPDGRGWLARLFGRRQPTTFHRCLAVHMHFADVKNRSALS